MPSCYPINVLIGHVTDTFYSEWTWWGMLEKVAHPSHGELAHRVLSFIDLCEDWNGRVGRNPANPPSAAEFDQFADLLDSGLWFVRDAEGNRKLIDEAPLFYPGGEFCWRLKSETAG